MRIRRASLVLAVLLALPLALQAQGGPPPRDPGAILHNPRALARYLHLTPDQITATQKLAADSEKPAIRTIAIQPTSVSASARTWPIAS